MSEYCGEIPCKRRIEDESEDCLDGRVEDDDMHLRIVGMVGWRMEAKDTACFLESSQLMKRWV